MSHLSRFRSGSFSRIALSSSALFLLAGCNPNQGSTITTVVTPPVVTSPVATPPSVTQPSVYVVQDGKAPPSIWVIPLIASGASSPSLEIAGSQVSVDGAGNIYVVSESNTSIDEYSVTSPLSQPVRSLSVGTGTKIPAIKDVLASATGEIFVSDGKGIAVFSPTATGNDDPVRYILGNSQPAGGPSTAITPGVITLDSSDNLYVQNSVDSSVSVFGPKDTGTVVPSRTIAGPLTHLTGSGAHYVAGMATDAAGNLYVACLCASADGKGNDFGVFEFDPAANGNVAPIRYVTAPEMYPNLSGVGLAVDSAGVIYVSASALSTGTPTVFEFSTTASGSVAPSNTLSGWLDAPPSRIAVH
jgi:hypothetical protein